MRKIYLAIAYILEHPLRFEDAVAEIKIISPD
jgi:hypothetical protein